MSVVGPRPLLPQYLGRYSPEQARWHEVDVAYVDTHTLWLDLRIILRTVGKVVRREGIAAQGSATMEEFGAP
jgi:lipopolysaccharide/colanic/teichoic acid biosynthesis glycosyltransferase